MGGRGKRGARRVQKLDVVSRDGYFAKVHSIAHDKWVNGNGHQRVSSKHCIGLVYRDWIYFCFCFCFCKILDYMSFC